jgi:hypothetical protein
MADTATEVETTVWRRIPYPVRSFLALHRARPVFVAMIGLGTLAALLGTYETTLPALSAARAVIPMWRLLAMGAAVLPVISLHSRLADLEVVTTRNLRRLERWFLLGASIGGAAIYLGLASLTLPAYVLAIIARSWLAWLGLALIAGAALGWRLAWTLPTAVAMVLWFWGLKTDGTYRWWEFSARPYSDGPSLGLSVFLLALGLVAYWATPWRRRRLRKLIRPG